jgi:hypothetical protein
VNPASTHFVLGYHGCDRRVAERVLAGKDVVRSSNNEWDWLGEGAYFWEANAQRAYEFAEELVRRPRSDKQRIKTPAVVGAVIDLRVSLNLLDSRFISVVRKGYERLVQLSKEAGMPLPENTGGRDLLRRHLDCAVMGTVHQIRADNGKEPFDTVRAAFTEGNSIYPTAGFAAKTHIQICVRQPACIKGYFRPLDSKGTPLNFAAAEWQE